MKILLVNPPRYKGTDYVREGRCMQPKSVWNNIWPPLTLNYLATLLEKKHNVHFIDCIGEKKDFNDLKKILASFEPDIVIINTGFPTISNDLDVSRIAKESNPKIITIAFGIFPTLLPKETLNFGVDFAIVAEPEATITELIESISAKKHFKDVRGLYYRSNVEFVFSGNREFISDLDNFLGFPNRQILKKDAYTFPFDKKPFALLMIGRGCPYKCSFCVTPLYYGKEFRIRDPKRVVDEMKECISKGINNFIFWGESFSTNKKYGEAICDEIIFQNLNVKWITTSRVDTINKYLLSKMKMAGCFLLGLGIETPNEGILKNVNKNTTITKIRDAVKMVKSAGIKSMGHFVLGFPGETRKTAEETLRFSKKIGVDYAQFYCAVPYPGTPFYEFARQKNWLETDDWEKYEQNYAVSRTADLSSKEIMEFRTRGFKEFYFRPAFIINHLSTLKNFKEIINTLPTGMSFIKWCVPKKTK